MRSSESRAGACLIATMIFTDSFRVLLDAQRAVGSAEAEGIGKRMLDAHWTGMVRDIVQIAFGVGCGVVGGRRRDLIANRQYRDARFEPSRAAQQMPRHRFGGADRHFIRMLAKAALHPAGFDLV